MLNQCFVQNWPPGQKISIDESMVPYYGRQFSKQFIRGKPIRFGFKVWCLNSRLGYLFQCEPYQGSSGSFSADLGLGGSAVTQLVMKLPAGLPYHLYTDNFLTSPRLLDHLKAMNISVTGTVRANRMEKCPLKEANQLKKECRGTFDHRLDRKSGMLAHRWNDNNVVTMLSNCFGVEPLTQARRRSAADKKHVQIPMPNMVAQYNSFMGGTDRMDQNVAKFRISIRIKNGGGPCMNSTVTEALFQCNVYTFYQLESSRTWPWPRGQPIVSLASDAKSLALTLKVKSLAFEICFQSLFWALNPKV